MTSRPGTSTVNVLLRTRSKHLVHAITITRVDGLVIRVTDHDRTFTFEGEKFFPAKMADLSAERREGGLRSGDQEASGFVDGAVITIPDLLGNRWRGAEVRDVIFDWKYPWHVPVRHRKWIRSVSWTGTQWVGVLQGRSQVTQRPAGGPFGGVFTTVCQFKLGDPLTCKKDISIGSGFAFAGGRVGTVIDPYAEVDLVVGTIGSGTVPDDFFRDGEIEWRWALAVVTSTNTATTTSTTLTDTTQTWTTNEHVGREVRILSGAGGFVQGSSWAAIVSNTATTLTFATQANMSGFAAGTNYDICGFADNKDVVSPVVHYVHATRHFEFLLPPPFPILVGDSGIVRAGCDGLLSTCKAKFDNILNHGGDPFAPSANAIIEPLEA